MLHNLLKQSVTSVALYSIFKIIIQSFEGIQALIEEVRNLFQILTQSVWAGSVCNAAF